MNKPTICGLTSLIVINQLHEQWTLICLNQAFPIFSPIESPPKTTLDFIISVASIQLPRNLSIHPPLECQWIILRQPWLKTQIYMGRKGYHGDIMGYGDNIRGDSLVWDE